MSPVLAFHSINEVLKPAHNRVYHSNNLCAPGRDVPSWERRSGTNNYRQCDICSNLNSQGR
jgi:hypothetical protein